MERFGSFIKGAFSYPRKLWETRPVTTAGIIITTLIYAVWAFIDSDYGRDRRDILELLSHIAMAVLFFTIFSLCLESIGLKKGSGLKYILFGVFAIVSIFLSALTYNPPSLIKKTAVFRFLDDLCGRAGNYSVYSFILGLLFIAFLLAVYFSYRRDVEQKFNDHVMNLSSSIFYSLIIFGVIQIGILLLFVIVEELLYGRAFEYIGGVLILINGLFFAPAVICALVRENEEANAFFRILVRYIMLILSMLAYVIIYAYILKLALTRSVPSNSVYSILTALFVISMYISYLCTTFENKGILQKFAYWSPLIFSPFIIMQCYTVIVRIGQYGLTPKRYFGIAFILFEIVYIIYYLVEYKRKMEIVGKELLLILGLFILVTVFVPGISAKQLSTFLAKRSLSTYLEKTEEKAEISDQEYLRADAAVGFLHDVEYGRNRLEKYFPKFDDDMKNELEERAKDAKGLKYGKNYGEDYEPPSNGWSAIELGTFTAADGFDISGYDRLRYVYIESDRTRNAADASKLRVYVYDSEAEIDKTGEPFMTVDLSDFVRDFIDITIEYDNQAYSEEEKEYKKISVIDLGENGKLYITRTDIRFNEEKEPEDITMDGYLLTKK